MRVMDILRQSRPELDPAITGERAPIPTLQASIHANQDPPAMDPDAQAFLRAGENGVTFGQAQEENRLAALPDEGAPGLLRSVRERWRALTQMRAEVEIDQERAVELVREHERLEGMADRARHALETARAQFEAFKEGAAGTAEQLRERWIGRNNAPPISVVALFVDLAGYERAAEFMPGEIKRLESEVAAADRALRDFRKRNDIKAPPVSD